MDDLEKRAAAMAESMRRYGTVIVNQETGEVIDPCDFYFTPNDLTPAEFWDIYGPSGDGGSAC